MIQGTQAESQLNVERAVSAVQRLACQIYHAAARLYLGEVSMPNDERQRRTRALLMHANRYYELTTKLREASRAGAVSEAMRQSVLAAAKDAEHHANTSAAGIINSFSS